MDCQLEDLYVSRKVKKKKNDIFATQGYQNLESKNKYVNYTYPHHLEHNLIFDMPLNTSLLSIFLGIVDSSLVNEIMTKLNEDPAYINGKEVIFTQKMIYVAMAFRIRLQGLQSGPKKYRVKASFNDCY